MTTVTMPTIPHVIPRETPPTTIPMPFGGAPFLTRRCTLPDPALTLSLRERCTACDGEGSIEIDIPGGVWTSNQGGMWVPDSRREACEACEGLGYRTRTRCLVCGAYHNTDEWGITKGEPECECSPADVHAALDALDVTEAVIARVAAAARMAREVGMDTSLTLHDVPWPHVLAIAARNGVIPRERFSSNGPFVVADAPVGALTVTLFGSVPAGGE